MTTEKQQLPIIGNLQAQQIQAYLENNDHYSIVHQVKQEMTRLQFDVEPEGVTHNTLQHDIMSGAVIPHKKDKEYTNDTFKYAQCCGNYYNDIEAIKLFLKHVYENHIRKKCPVCQLMRAPEDILPDGNGMCGFCEAEQTNDAIDNAPFLHIDKCGCYEQTGLIDPRCKKKRNDRRIEIEGIAYNSLPKMIADEYDIIIKMSETEEI